MVRECTKCFLAHLNGSTLSPTLMIHVIRNTYDAVDYLLESNKKIDMGKALIVAVENGDYHLVEE